MNNYKDKSNKELAEELGNGITMQQINSWLIHHGIKRGKYQKYYNEIFSKEDIKFIEENYTNMTSTKIGNILGFTKRQIDGKIQELNLNSKRRKINSSYFHNIDTSLKAYFIGFIYADGWICYNQETGNYEFGIELQSSDKYILEKLNEELGGENIIYHSDPSEVLILNKQIAHSGHSDILRVYSKELVTDLISNGIVKNKSSKDIYPIVQEEFFFDFLRGYIDGDGCYYVDNKKTYMHITSASLIPLQYIQKKLLSYNIETKIYSENEKKHRIICV